MTQEEWDEFKKNNTTVTPHPIHEYNDVEEPFRVPKLKKMLKLKYPDKFNVENGTVFLYDTEAEKGSRYEYFPVGAVAWEASDIDPSAPQMVGTYVEKDYSNNGIGKQLYERLVDLMRSQNINHFYSDYQVSDNAKKLYKHLEEIGYPVEQVYDKKNKAHVYRVRL